MLLSLPGCQDPAPAPGVPPASTPAPPVVPPVTTPVSQAKPITLTLPAALFTDPVKIGQGQASPVIMDQLVALIDATPERATIHLAIYLFSYQPVVEALKRANKREVQLNLLVDMSREDSQKENPATIAALRLLQTHTDLVICDSDAGSTAINHNKFVLFSAISTPAGLVENVVLQTSHNFTVSDSKKMQDALVLSHPGLYQAYATYWQDMKAKAAAGMKDFYYREYEDAAQGLTAFFFPKRRAGAYYGEDTIIEILNGLSDPASATIQVGMSDWVVSRRNVLDKLAQLHDQGAKVEIVAKSSVDPEILAGLQSLRQKGALVKIYNMTLSSQPKINIHSKFMLLQGTWRGSPGTLLVTGSHNFTTNALRSNNEAMLMLKDHPLFAAFQANYTKLKALPGL
ncbi:MAG: phospholipase D-like domain-containing protein [Adhaeribacter sp.]